MARHDGLRKTVMLILAALVVITLSFKFDITSMFSIPTHTFRTPPQPAELKISYEHTSNDISDPRDPRFYNIILEEKALEFRPCEDENKAASIRNSKISLTDRVQRTYNIGEYIRASVILYDEYGNRKYSGGDQLRATIEKREINASAPCVVTDNNDGTQTVACEALWSGTSTIYVNLAYTRETITFIYRLRTEVSNTRNIDITFRGRNSIDVTACHPNDTHLLKDKDLGCVPRHAVRSVRKSSQKFTITKCEDILWKKGQQTLEQTLTVQVRNKKGGSHVSIIDEPSLPCSAYNITRLWQSRVPTGFFYGGKWILRNCIGFQQNRYKACLRNKRLYLFGDSTTKAWYQEVLKRFNCQGNTEKGWKDNLQNGLKCYNNQIDFEAGWYPDGRMDRIPNNAHAIVVLHMYMHVTEFRHSVFKQRMEIIRKSVDKFLAQNKRSIVMIKAPHTFQDTPAGKFRLSDYFGYVFSKLLYDIFEGLHDRIVLLNNRDTTIAQHVEWNHPPENIINAMIDQMLSYACD